MKRYVVGNEIHTIGSSGGSAGFSYSTGASGGGYGGSGGNAGSPCEEKPDSITVDSARVTLHFSTHHQNGGSAWSKTYLLQSNGGGGT